MIIDPRIYTTAVLYYYYSIILLLLYNITTAILPSRVIGMQLVSGDVAAVLDHLGLDAPIDLFG